MWKDPSLVIMAAWCLTSCVTGIVCFTGCSFGGQFYSLEDTWHPDLGEPFGVMHCVQCYCEPVSFAPVSLCWPPVCAAAGGTSSHSTVATERQARCRWRVTCLFLLLLLLPLSRLAAKEPPWKGVWESKLQEHQTGLSRPRLRWSRPAPRSLL